MTGDERRLKIFNLFAANWTMVHPRYSWSSSIPESYNKAVVCPLCLHVFNQSSLNQRLENPLSLEHIPPSELGGKARILTCKRCNNDSGRLLDFTVAEHIKAEPFMRLQGGSEILGTTSLNHSYGKKINSRTIIRIGKKDMFIFKAQIPKGEWRAEQLKKIDAKAPITINFKFSVPSLKHVHIALLRIAYLFAFEKFGHPFILNEVYNGLRHQILQPDKDILEPVGSMLSKSINIADGIYVVDTPFGLKSLLVVFTLKTKPKTHKACVFLPSPFTDSIEYYQRFKEFGSNNFKVDTSERFLDINFITDKDYTFSFKKPFNDVPK